MKRKRGPNPVLTKKKGRDQAETSVVYGVMPVLEALRASTGRVRKIAISSSRNDAKTREISELAKDGGVPLLRVSPVEFSDLVPSGVTHQGVAAFVRNVEFISAEELISKTTEGGAKTFLVLDGIEDPRNLGAIIRTAECAGVTGIFVPSRRAAGMTDTVVKASAGALNYVDIARVTNIKRLLEDLKEAGVWIVGTAGDADTAYTEWDFTQPTAIVLGGEGTGIRRLTGVTCDTLVKIPMCGTIDSLNVSVAAGVLLFEAVRQKSLSDS